MAGLQDLAEVFLPCQTPHTSAAHAACAPKRAGSAENPAQASSSDLASAVSALSRHGLGEH